MTTGTARWVGAAILIGAIGVALLFGNGFDVAGLKAGIEGLGIWAPIGFVVAFATAAVLFLPGAAFGLAGGAIFGPLWGAVLNVVGGTVGAVLAFLIARNVAGDWVRRRAGGRLDELVRGVEAEGWRFVAFVRLVPVFPFNLSNYALGLTRISLLQYGAATAICMIPGSAAYAWLGHAGISATTGEQDAIWYALLGVAAVAVIALLPRMLKRFRGGAASIVSWIEPAQVAALWKEGGCLAIVDVREGDEVAGVLGHIPGAFNIPLGSIVADPNQVARFKDRLVVLVCKTDRRSATAAQALADVKLWKVSVLRGGMERWNALGLPVEREPGAATAHANAIHSE